MCFYAICEANEYLVKTGLFIKDIYAAKKTMKWPFQKVKFINLSPVDYMFDLNNMSKELVPFKLPMVFTIGPIDPNKDMEGFLRYARRISGLSSEDVTKIISGVIHGETRVLSAKLTVQEMFADRQKFKTEIQENVAKLLEEFGLKIENCNISEMKDLDAENKYFYNLKQKALEEASNQAKIDIAEAKKKGDIGEKERQGETEKRVKVIETDVTQAKNEREQAIALSNKDLAIARYQFKKDEEIEKVESMNAPLLREQELVLLLNQKKAAAKLEELRANDLAKKKVDAEGVIATAQGEAGAKNKLADAALYEAQKEAEGIRAKALAQAEGLQKMLSVSDPNMVRFYLAVDKGVYVDMATKLGDAVRGLAPKINIWNTGYDGASSDPYKGIKDIFTCLPPILEAVDSQTGMKMPDWLPHQENNTTKETFSDGDGGFSSTSHDH